MINTLIIGLGNIGFKFDKKNMCNVYVHSTAKETSPSKMQFSLIH